MKQAGKKQNAIQIGKNDVTHFVLVALFFLSIFILIKNLTAPIWFDNWFCRLFLCSSNAKVNEVLEFMELFAAAYATSYLFYLTVEVYPQKKNNRKMVKIIIPKLVSIQRSMSQITAMLEFMQELQKIDSMNDILFSGELVCIKRIDLATETHFEELDEIVFSEECNTCMSIIEKELDFLEGLTGFGYYSEEIIDFLIDMKFIEFNHLVPLVAYNEKKSFRGHEIEKKYAAIKALTMRVERITNVSFRYVFSLMSDNEKNAYYLSRENLKKQCGELLKNSYGVIVRNGIKIRKRDI